MSYEIFQAGLIVNEPVLDLETMQSHSAEWNIICKEMGKTLCSASLHGVHTPRIQIARTYHSQALLIQGDFPKKSVLLNYTKTETPYSFQNRIIQPHEVVITQSGGELDFFASGENEVFTIAIEETLFHSAFDDYYGKESRLLFQGSTLSIKAGHLDFFLQGLSEWIIALKHVDSTLSQEFYEGVEKEILEHIFSCLSIEHKRLDRIEITATQIRKALDATLQDHVSIPSLAKKLGISERQLHHAFKSTYGFTPKKYLQSLRLNAIRDELLHMDMKDVLVSDIALKHGYLHMGHFAAQYKKLFKENPSETLYNL